LEGFDFIVSLLPGAVLGAAVGSLVMSVVLFYLATLDYAPRGLKYWAFALLANMVHMAAILLSPYYNSKTGLILAESMYVLEALLFMAGGLTFFGRPLPLPYIQIAASAALGWIFVSPWVVDRDSTVTLPVNFAVGVILAITGWLFLKAARKGKFAGFGILGGLFFLWALHNVFQFLLLKSPWGAQISPLVSMGLELMIAVLLIILAQRRQNDVVELARRRAESSERRAVSRERHLNAVLEHMADGIVTLDPKGRVLSINPAGEVIFGFMAGDIIGRDFDLLVPGGDAITAGLSAQSHSPIGLGRDPEMDGASRLRRRGVECLGTRKDGAQISLDMMASNVALDERTLRVVVMRDVSHHKMTVRVEDLARSLTQDLVEGADVDHILSAICHGVANIFWMPLVWIGFCEPDGQVTVRSSFGDPAERLKSLRLRWDDTPGGENPAGDAVRSIGLKSASFVDNPYGEGLEAEWQAGYRAVAAVPLMARRRAIGVLQVYSAADEFSPHMLQTMETLAPRLGMIIQAGLDQRSLRLQSAAMLASASAIVIADAEGRVEWGNAAFSRFSGYDADEISGQRLSLFSSETQGALNHEEMLRCLKEGQVWHGETVERRKDGSLYTVEQTVTPMLDAQGAVAHFVVVQEDLTERKRAEERIRYLSQYDTLTALPNRRLFNEKLGLAVARAGHAKTKLAVLFIDLDKFSRVNDTMGHSAGDKVLVGVVERLRSAARAAETLARVGGDEFAVILSDLPDADGAAQLAHRVIAAIDAPFAIDGVEVRIGATLGIAMYPDDGETPELLVKNADLAMYRAIQETPGGLRFFSSQMNEEINVRLDVERDLRRAIEQEEFLLYYQPQIDAASGRIVGFEALVRWQHPEKGLVAPGMFIPVAEDTGLIVPIGEWVLRQACRQAQQWQDEGLPPVTMAVNISPAQFTRQDLTGLVRRQLDQSRLNPSCLELELTETVVMQDAEGAISMLNHLSGLGIKIAIDDFGTGYSSLNYLKRFPVHRLKIDQSFVREVINDANDAEIARAVIALGHSLDLEVVSEGVETPEQMAYLTAQGCDILQGFLFSRPVPAAAARDLLARQPFADTNGCLRLSA
jgi:diguanylate cyclase (GGDEF)-like protein/PAS domain S-box-containing protein